MKDIWELRSISIRFWHWHLKADSQKSEMSQLWDQLTEAVLNWWDSTLTVRVYKYDKDEGKWDRIRSDWKDFLEWQNLLKI